jgi:predicted metal-binding membrane protein
MPPRLFAGGYLLTWAAAGLVAYAPGVTVTTIAGDALAWRHAGRGLAGAALILAAIYQLTSLKGVCLGNCRRPFLVHDADSDPDNVTAHWGTLGCSDRQCCGPRRL